MKKYFIITLIIIFNNFTNELNAVIDVQSTTIKVNQSTGNLTIDDTNANVGGPLFKLGSESIYIEDGKSLTFETTFFTGFYNNMTINITSPNFYTHMDDAVIKDNCVVTCRVSLNGISITNSTSLDVSQVYYIVKDLSGSNMTLMIGRDLIKADIIKFRFMMDGGHYTIQYDDSIPYSDYFYLVPNENSKAILTELDKIDAPTATGNTKALLDYLNGSSINNLNYNISTLDPVNPTASMELIYYTLSQTKYLTNKSSFDRIYSEERAEVHSEFWFLTHTQGYIKEHGSIIEEGAHIPVEGELSNVQIGYLVPLTKHGPNDLDKRSFLNVTFGLMDGGIGNSYGNNYIDGYFLGARFDYSWKIFNTYLSNIGLSTFYTSQDYNIQRVDFLKNTALSDTSSNYMIFGLDYSFGKVWIPSKEVYRLADRFMNTEYGDRFLMNFHIIKYGLYLNYGMYNMEGSLEEGGTINYELDDFNSNVLDIGLFLDYKILKKLRNKHTFEYGAGARISYIEFDNSSISGKSQEISDDTISFTYDVGLPIQVNGEIFAEYNIGSYTIGAMGTVSLLQVDQLDHSIALYLSRKF